MPVFTCKDCPNRTCFCHATCNKYIEEKHKHDLTRARRRKAKMLENYIADRKMSILDDTIKKYGKPNR